MNSLRLYYISYFFFFQAEDGIRDLVRSRGLGDVYKRQILRLEDPTSGRVLLDNTDVRDLNLPWLRGRMGVVLSLIHI